MDAADAGQRHFIELQTGQPYVETLKTITKGGYQ
jgi:hypothetical protein